MQQENKERCGHSATHQMKAKFLKLKLMFLHVREKVEMARDLFLQRKVDTAKTLDAKERLQGLLFDNGMI